ILAGWRLSVLARFEGYALALSPALKANAAGVALSQVMISFLGQAVGRAAILRRAGIPADVTITMGVFERLTAAAALSSVAVVAALYLFGQLSFGQGTETEYLLWAGIGLLVSTLLAMVFVYRDMLTSLIRQLNLRKVGRDFLAVAGISVIVHGAMLGAYLALASAFTEEALPIDLLAACLVVMFTASLPISFGGWGVRELSAAAVLPFAGLTVTQGVLVALLVGVGALVVHLPIWFAVSGRDRTATNSTKDSAERNGMVEQTGQRYLSWLAMLVPVLASIAIPFNLHVPTADEDLNINLADPLVIVGGMLAAAYWLERGVLPSWRVPALNVFTVMAMAVLCLAAIIGYLDFGFSTWAFRNRLGGWLLLLAYAGTGALMVVNLGDDGRRLVLKGLVVGLAAIAALDVGKLAYSLLGLTFFGEIKAASLQGYSQNPNAFAFLLMAGLCATIAALRVKEPRAMERVWLCVAAVLGTALLLTGSRAGWGTLALICVTALLIDRRLLKPIAKAVAMGAALTFLIVVLPYIEYAAGKADRASKMGHPISVFELGTNVSGDAISDEQRWKSVEGGLRLWRENPVLGAGLGAHFEETKRSGEPLVIHNTLIWLLAETGLVGFLVFFSAGVAIFWASTRRLRDPTDVGATTIFLFLLAFASMSMVHELLYQRVLWFVLGVCLASVPILRSDTPLEKKP
ncbi:MAG TPA: O-antigen ligase family protein, partial [Kiloniellales bacterium]